MICSPRNLRLGSALAAVLGLLALGAAQAVERPHHGPGFSGELPSPGKAPVKLTVAATDSPLVLHAVLDGKGSSSASGSVRLVLPGHTTVSLHLLASDLHAAADPALRIERGDVSIPSGTSLTGDLPHNLRITVSNIPRPGTYFGQLTFFVPNQTTPALELPVQVQARARPEVVPVRAMVTRQLVSCRARLSCFLASYILSDGVVSDELLLQLENRTREPVTVVESALILRGEHSNATVPHAVITPLPALPRVLPANQVVPLGLLLQRHQLPADRYQGSLRLLIRGSDEPVSINLDLSVRHGPLWPMLILLLGIGVGRLVQKMDAPDVQKQMKMMELYHGVSERAAGVEHPGSVQFVGRELLRVKGLIEIAKDPEEALQLAIEKAGALIELLLNIEELERRADKTIESVKAQVTREGNAARKLLTEGKFAQAEEQRLHMESLLADDRMSGEGPSPSTFDGEQRLAVLQTAAHAVADNAWRKVKAALSFLSGLSTHSADVRYWLMRPLLSVALLLLLSLLGLQQLYVSAGTTFGSTGLYDYLGLFIWGLSADIAQRNLHSLPGLAGR